MSLQVENPPDELRESAPRRNGYRVMARWSFGKSGLVQSDSAPNVIPFTAPPRFGGMEGRWKPEDLLLAAIASCYTATFCALAEYSKFRYVDLDVEARGDLRKADTGYSLTEIAICPRLTIGDGEEEQRALCLLHKAKAACLVSRLLSVEPAFKPAATGGGLARRFCLRRQHRLGGCNMTMTLEAGSRVALKTTPAWFLLREPVSFSDDVMVTRLEHTGNTVRVTVVQSSDPNAGSLTMEFTENPMVLRQWTVVDPKGKAITVALSDLQFGMALDPNLFQNH